MYPHALSYCFFFFNDTATTEIYTLSLHDALPILRKAIDLCPPAICDPALREAVLAERIREQYGLDRKSTRLNSSHGYISYAVFCLKKKTFARPLPPDRNRQSTVARIPRSAGLGSI